MVIVDMQTVIFVPLFHDTLTLLRSYTVALNGRIIKDNGVERIWK
jgi:hypothetical protein